MKENDVPQESYIITVKNSRTTSMVLNLEPEGWSWVIEPGEIFEIVFEKHADFWAMEPLIFDDDGVTFWGAFPSAVLLVRNNEREELMRQRALNCHSSGDPFIINLEPSGQCVHVTQQICAGRD